MEMGREKWKEKMKGSEIAASLAIVLSLLCLLPVGASAQAVVAIENASALPNETTTTNVTAYNVTNLGNFGITVMYDPSVVNVTNVTGGPGVGNFIWERISDGEVRFYTVNTLEIPSLSGDITLATLTLKAVGAAGSESPLNLEIGKLLDNKSNPIPAIPKNGTFKVLIPEDRTPPTTEVMVTPPEPATGWWNSSVMLTFHRYDDLSGVNFTAYRMAGATTKPWTQVFGEENFTVNITAEGITTVYYFSADKAGYWERTKSMNVSIDRTPPVIISVEIDRTGVLPGDMINVTVKANDALSGILEIRADGIPLTHMEDFWYGNITAASSPGTYNVTVEAIDRAWNIAVNDSVQYVVVKEKPDLIVSDVLINPECTHEMFANESNTINATICNIGGDDAGAFGVRFSIAGIPFATKPVSGLNAGECVNVSATTPTTPSIPAGDYTLTVEADIGNHVNETNEENNIWSQTVTVYNNGYKGKRYTGGEDIKTVRNYTVKGGVVYSVGDSRYLSGSAPWEEYVVNWTSTDFQIPAGARVVEARLYVYYTWDKVGAMPDNVSMEFNGNTVEMDAFYTDRKGFGSWDYPSGMLAYNVTAYIKGKNTAVLRNLNPVAGNPSIYGMLLVVVYENAEEPERMIWINEGCDILQASNNYCVSSKEATAFATFAGTIEDNVTAKLITVVPSGDEGDDKNRLYFNNKMWSGIWDGFVGNTQLAINETDVTDALRSTNNFAVFQSNIPEGDTKGDYMVATNAILEVTPPPEKPFHIYGYVFYANGSACNGPIVSITNLNRTETWRAETSPDSNYYELNITTANVSAGDVLRFEAMSPDGIFINITNYTVTEGDIANGGIFNFNLTLSEPPIFNYSDLRVAPTEGEVPLEISVCALVENIGGSAGEYNATLKINEEVVKFETGWLGVGENTTVCFNYTFTEVGTYNVTIDDLPAVEVTVTPPPMITVNITTPPGNTSCTWFLINYTYKGDVVGFNVSTDNITWIPNGMNLSYKFTNLPNRVPTTLYVRATGATGQFAYDSITVTSYLGDINDNGEVDLPDLAILGAAYGTKRGETGFNEKADLNGDDEVGLPDLAMLGAHYGEKYW